MMTRQLVLRVAGPPIAGFVLVVVFVAAEALGFRGFATVRAETISEAALLGHAARALQLIADGQDPNARLHVREGLVDGAAHEFTPIESATLGRHRELVQLLERSGATNANNARATCFARMRLDGDADVDTTLGTCPPESAAP